MESKDSAKLERLLIKSWTLFWPFVLYRFFFWSLLGFPIFIASLNGWITAHTNVPNQIQSFVNDLSSLGYFFLVFVITVILAGLSCLFPTPLARKIMKMSLDDSPKLFVDLAMFWFWLGLIIASVVSNWISLLTILPVVVELAVLSYLTWVGTEWIKAGHCVFKPGEELPIVLASHNSDDEHQEDKEPENH